MFIFRWKTLNSNSILFYGPTRDKQIVKLPNIWPQLGRRGMKPTTRTRAQNPLPEFFEVAKKLYIITLF